MELNSTSSNNSNFHRIGRSGSDSTGHISNVMMGAFFLNNNNSNSNSSKSSSSALATDRRAVLDLFSLYAKAVRIIWTYDATEFCCNADSGRCGFVTNDLETFLRHAADTRRCEACDLHVHQQKDGAVFCEKCASASGNITSNNNNGLLGVLDMTIERPVKTEPKKIVNNNKRKQKLGGNNNKNNVNIAGSQSPSLFGSMAIIPESQVKGAKRGRPSRSKLGANDNNDNADFADSKFDQELSCSSLVSQDSTSCKQDQDNCPQSSSTTCNNNNNDNNLPSGGASGCGDEELVECNHCGRMLRKESLRTHVARRHENARHHTCQFCDYQSYDAYVMREHVRRHLGQYLFKCDLCPFQAVKKYQLDSHMRRHTGEKPFRCSLCAYACAWNVQLKSHMPLHENGTDEERAARTCPTCGVLFSSSGTFSRHPCVKGGGGDSSANSDSAVAVEVVPKTTKKRLLISTAPMTEQLALDLHGDNHDDQSSSSPNVVLRKRSFRVPLVLPTATPGECSSSPKLAIPQTASSSSSETIFQLPSVAQQTKQQSSNLESSAEIVEDVA